jgi:tRNA pseudouridine13 synthase
MLTLTKQAGIGGEVKSEPDDFIVKEITGSGVMLEPGVRYTPQELKESEAPAGKFTTFVLQKKNWDNTRALLEIAKRMSRGRKSIGYAGTKDKRSISVQLACIYGVEPANVEAVRLNDISINGAWKSNGIEMGSNIGNGFSIKVKDVHDTENIPPIIEELGGTFPSYFDRQRFGYRLNNAKIGLDIINNKQEEAVMAFLTDSSNENDLEAREARKVLSEEQDFQKALDYFPRHLRYERTMIDYLARYKNFANAIRKIPRGIAIMFIHAVEDLVFNMVLEERIRAEDFESKIYCGKNFYGFPDSTTVSSEKRDSFPLSALVGYETKDEYISEHEKEVMERIGINKESFKVKSMPELGMKGAFRPMLSPFKDFSSALQENNAVLNFSIPSGSYATIFINEITKNNGLDLKDLMPNGL